MSVIVEIVRPVDYESKFITTEGNTSINSETYQAGQVFSFDFKEDYVTVVSNSNVYLTVIRDFVLWTKTDTIDDRHRFNYILTPDTITLFKYNTSFTKVITFPEEDLYKVQDIDTRSSDPLPLDSILHIDNLSQRRTDYIHNTNSFTARYKTESAADTNSIEVNEQIKLTNYKANLLFSIPVNNNTYTYDLYINSLKNYYTSNYTGSFIPTLTSDINSHRAYTNISIGSNQSKGYENIHLNYFSNTLTFTLSKDKDTIFLAPPALPVTGVYLSATSLYADGAVASNCPFTSDRIAFKARDYRELSITSAPNDIVDNTWQCAWLSAGESGEAVWMDRHYYGTQIDVNSYEELLIKPTSFSNIVDTPSTMKILPNREYRYFHQGQNNIKTYTKMFKYTYPDQSAEILNIDEWDSNTLIDKSVSKNNGEQVGSSSLTTKNKLHLDGSNFAIFPSINKDDDIDRELYVGIWLEASDWKYIQGNQLLGNFANGGFGLFNNQVTPTSLITLCDKANNYIYNLNPELSVVSETYNVKSIDSTDKVIVQRLSDLTYLIVNCTKKYINRYDINNNLILHLPLDTFFTEEITQIEVDSRENIYCFSRAQQAYASFTKDGGTINLTRTLSDIYDRIECVYDYSGVYMDSIITASLESKDVLIGIKADMSVVDIHNNVWSIKGVNLYKNREYFASVGDIIDINSDSTGYVWLLHASNLLIKIDPIQNIIVDSKKAISKDAKLLKGTASIEFITSNINNTQTDLLLLIDSAERSITVYDLNYVFFNKIYLDNINSSLFIKNNFNVSTFSFVVEGDCTGYNYLRKFKKEDTLEWRIACSDTSPTAENYNQTLFNLPFNVSHLDSGKHYMSLCFSSSKGYIKAYLDGAEVASISVEPFVYSAVPSTRPLTLGANTAKQSLLRDTINSASENKFQGYIYALHIYRYALNSHDIGAMYYSLRDIDLYKDLKWNINLGRRNYIERIDKFFTFNMPGIKSKYYNVRIYGFNIDNSVRESVSSSIFNILPRINPADTILNTLIWE
jgi:hypothetical protein